MTRPPGLAVSIDGMTYTLHAGDLSALDAKDFHAAVGVRLLDVFRKGPQDLDEVAGLVWLARRQRERGLPYEAVAAGVNYDTILKVEAEQMAADAEDDADPET